MSRHEAEKRGFCPVRILTRRVDPSPDGKVFFVAELLEADNGARWWKRRREASDSGQPFTPRFTREAEAKRAVEHLEEADSLSQAAEILAGEGVAMPARDILARAYASAASTGVPVHPQEVADTYRAFCAWSEATHRLLEKEGASRQPSRFELEQAFFAAGVRSPEAMLDVFAEEERRQRNAEEQALALATAKRTLEESGAECVTEAALTRLRELLAVGREQAVPPDELVARYRVLRAIVDEVRSILEADGFEAVPTPRTIEGAYFGGHTSTEALANHWRGILQSERLQAQKLAERRERREREAELIHSMAAVFAAKRGFTLPSRSDLELIGTSAPDGRWPSKNPSDVLDQIHEALADQPWLRHIIIHEGKWPHLYISEDGLQWQQDQHTIPVESRYKIAEISSLSDAYGPVVDWDKPWHVLRPKLLNYIKDRELDLLHRADVRAALARAREAGKELVVFGHVAYQWVDGEWKLREIVRRDRSGLGRGATLWLAGPIISQNFGRIIILPFIKSDGTKVQGYTRNSAYEGEAPPRAEPRLIPFELYARNGRDDTWVHSGEIVVPDEQTIALR